MLPVISKAAADPVDLRYGLTAGNILLAALLVFGSVGLSVLISARNILKLQAARGAVLAVARADRFWIRWEVA